MEVVAMARLHHFDHAVVLVTERHPDDHTGGSIHCRSSRRQRPDRDLVVDFDPYADLFWA
jgi:hypothetical protein